MKTESRLKALFFDIRKVTAVVMIVSVLSACGSDKSSSATPQTQNAAPSVRITGPTDGGMYKQGESIQFIGEAGDNEDGALSGAALVWTSSLDGQIGTGGSFTTTALTVGVHQITLAATDTGGVSSASVITLTIQPLVHLSGAISTASRNATDGDTNDPNEAYTPNNTLATAQKLSNPATVNGFLTASATGGGAGGNDRFAREPDQHDIFQITLAVGQTIYLQIADWLDRDTRANDLDLFLLDQDGNLLASSNGTGRAEELSISQGGDYYIWLNAYEGKSNYVLTVSDASAHLDVLRERFDVAEDFLAGQALVKFHDRKTGSSDSGGHRFAATANLLNLRAASAIPGRANLMSFDINRKDSRSASAVSGRQSIVQAAQGAGVKITPEVAAKLATLERIKELGREATVEFAEPNRIRKAMLTPDDNFYPQQWDFPAINIPNAWDMADGNGVIVAVIDSGVYLNHPDLVHQLVPGYDFISDPAGSGDGDGIDNDPDDPGDGTTIGASSFHGTHVAGTIAAQTNNTEGVAGIAFNARIMPLRTLGSLGGTDADIAECIYFAAGLSNGSGTLPSKRADIINMSLGGAGQSKTLAAAIKAARNAGLIVIAAAGNDNSDVFYSPADEEGVVAVSAVGQDGLKAYYSNFGPHIDVAAPGGDFMSGSGILSASAKDNGRGLKAPSYKSLQGTSMAAPHMAGVVALMKSVYPALGPDDLDNLLMNTAITNDIGTAGRDDLYGHGVIDALDAVYAAQQLSGGGSLPGYLTINPTTHDFGVNSETIVAVSASDTTISVAQVVNEVSWLTVSPQTVSDKGLGDYRLQIDRTGLSPARYSATVVFVADNDRRFELRVYMDVLQDGEEKGGNVGLVYVLLLNESASESLYTVEATFDAEGYHFVFDGVPAGNYRLVAGTDHDNDQLVSDSGEACGAYPTVDNSTIISVNGNMADVNFIIHPDTQLVTKNILFQKTPRQPLF